MAYVAMTKTDVCDLHVMLGGSKNLVKLERGQVVPVEFLDAMDVKKSLAFGALGRLLKAGMIKEVADEKAAAKLGAEIASVIPLSQRETPVEVPPIIPSKTTKYDVVQEMSPEEIDALRQEKGMVQSVDLNKDGPEKSINVEAIPFEMAVGTNKGGSVGLVVAERRTELGEVNDAVVDPSGMKHIVGAMADYEPKTDLSQVSTYSQFMGLNHFDKLLGIKGFTDKTLLSEIAEKSEAKQLQNTARKRLSELA